MAYLAFFALQRYGFLIEPRHIFRSQPQIEEFSPVIVRKNRYNFAA